jgi:hypothetical protein
MNAFAHPSASERTTSDRSQARERQAERGGDFNDQPPF